MNPVRPKPVRLNLGRLALLCLLGGFALGPAWAQPAAGPAASPQTLTLTLRWSVPEPVLVGDRVERPLIHRSARLTFSAAQRQQVQATRSLAGVRAELNALYRQIEAREPRDVRFVRQQGRWVGRATTGWKVDRRQTEERLLAALRAGQARATSQGAQGMQRTPPVTLALNLLAPARSVRWAQERGVRHLATGDSTFTGSPDFRVHNIRVGASRLHGRWVAPGRELNFNALVGRVSAGNGFRQGFVVVGDTLSMEDGGGLCQVSTTLFRAAVNAGLPITERHAHSIQVGYYGSPGLDAAVYAPTKNLRWRNDTPGPLLVQAEWNVPAERLAFHFFGVSDGRRVQLLAPRVRDLVTSPPPTFIADRTLAQGEVKRVDMPAPGARVAVVREILRPGKKVVQDVFRSVYRPWGGVFAVPPGDSRVQ